MIAYNAYLAGANVLLGPSVDMK